MPMCRPSKPWNAEDLSNRNNIEWSFKALKHQQKIIFKNPNVYEQF